VGYIALLDFKEVEVVGLLQEAGFLWSIWDKWRKILLFLILILRYKE
jgi:hypothetical protein